MMVVDSQEFCTIGIRVDELKERGRMNVAYPIRPYIIETGAEIAVSAITIEESATLDDILRAHLTIHVTEITHGKPK